VKCKSCGWELDGTICNNPKCPSNQWEVNLTKWKDFRQEPTPPKYWYSQHYTRDVLNHLIKKKFDDNVLPKDLVDKLCRIIEDYENYV
jgi:hypothetical protein